jgi:hypothetical protein
LDLYFQCAYPRLVDVPQLKQQQQEWHFHPAAKSAWGTFVDEGTFDIDVSVPDLPSVGVVIKGVYPKVRTAPA